MDLNTQQVHQVISALNSHPEALRIKKILYCFKYQSWVNDAKALDAESFAELTQNLLKTQPNINRLIKLLDHLVSGLNRQEIYAPIAKSIIEILAPAYQIDPKIIEESTLQARIEQQNNQPVVSHTYTNLMEAYVDDEIFKELQKLPVNTARFINVAEVATYALNRLPALYISSEEGKKYQSEKIVAMQASVRAAVLQGISAVMRDPLRKSTPLKLDTIHTSSQIHILLIELEELIQKMSSYSEKLSYGELVKGFKATLDVYHSALKEVEGILALNGLGQSQLTPKNLASSLRKAFRKLLLEQSAPAKDRGQVNAEDSLQRQLNAQETAIMEFARENEAETDQPEQTQLSSVRDWYHF